LFEIASTVFAANAAHQKRALKLWMTPELKQPESGATTKKPGGSRVSMIGADDQNDVASIFESP
jgi:hypothetical protein